jgi:hypothetical protein
VSDIPVAIERKKIDPSTVVGSRIFDNNDVEPNVGGIDGDVEVEDFRHWNDWDSIPAAAAASFEYSTGDIAPASLCTPVKDYYTYDTYMLTAGHNMSYIHPTPKYAGASARPKKTNNEFNDGENPSHGNVGLDVLDAGYMFHNNQNTPMTYEFATGYGGTRGEISGTISRDKLKDLNGRETSPYESISLICGRTDTYRYLEIDSIGGNAFETTLSDSKPKGGDSGSPYVYKISGFSTSKLETPGDTEVGKILSDTTTVIAGVHQGSTTTVSGTIGTSMPDIESEYSVTI